MVSTFTPNLNLEIPARGDYANQWDLPMDASLTTIDNSVGGVVVLSGLTGGDVYLTAAQAANQFFYIEGNLAANQFIAFPPVGGRKYILMDITLNGFGVYVRGNNFNDQTGVYFLTSFTVPIPIIVMPNRVYWDYGGIAPGSLGYFPTTFVYPGWIPCDGRYCNTSQQDLLFDILGYSFGGGGTNFAVPDYRGFVNPCADDVGTGPAGRLFNVGVNWQGGETEHVLQVAELAAHSHGDYGHGHAVYDPGHAHGGVMVPVSGGGYYSLASVPPEIQSGGTAVAGTNISLYAGYANLADTGSNSGHNNVQLSYTVMTCIRW
jgi:microcystin-dependent protein